MAQSTRGRGRGRGRTAAGEGQTALAEKPVAKPVGIATDVTCSLCLDQLEEPKLLPCLHSFCKDCLEGLDRKTKSKGQIACPQCRCMHSVPKGGVDGFPADLVATHTLAFKTCLQQPIAQSTKPVSCNMCTVGDPATNHCPACSRFLCEFCSKAHGRQVDYCTHKLVPVDKADAEALKAFERPQYCTQHRGEILKLYCATCQQLICRDCTIVAHRDHSFGFTSSLRPNVEEEIREMAKGIAAKQKEFESHLAFINATEKGRSDHSTALTKEINTAFDAFIRLVEQQRQKLLQQEENANNEDLKRVWGQKEFIEVTLAGFASGLRYVDRLCSCANDQDMLAMSHKVRQQLSALQRTTWAPDSTFQCSNLFTFQGVTNGQSIAQSLGSLTSIQASQFLIYMIPCSVRPVRRTSQVDLKLKLRHKAQFEVKLVGEPKLKHLAAPSVSVIDRYTNQSLDYTHNLVYDQGKKLWLLTVKPTYPGFFDVFVFIGPKPTVCSGADFGRGEGAAYGTDEEEEFPVYRDDYNPDPGEYYNDDDDCGSGAGFDELCAFNGSTSFSYTINVTGNLKPGDRVCRGPDWPGGDEDGGEGSEGVVIDSKTQQTCDGGLVHMRSRKTVDVCWLSNGSKIQYTLSGQGETYPIELVPC